MNITILKRIYLTIFASLCTTCVTFNQKALGAEKVAFINGPFQRSIKVDNLIKLASSGEAKGALKQSLKLSNQNPLEIAEFLNQELNLSVTVTSKLMYSRIGEVLIGRVAKVIYPIRVPDKSVSIPAIRSAVIQALVANNGNISVIEFIKCYPNRIMAINLPNLLKVIKKVESINDLIQFFSTSPLEDLKTPKTKS